MSKWVVDLSDSDLATKEAFLKEHAQDSVLMDLTCFDPQDFYARFPQLKGVCATLLSRNGKCEAHFREGEAQGVELLKQHGFTAVLSNVLTPGFVVPRTVATIVNEAFYALEDKVASRSDIDRAMKFGVNYPRGPFEWCAGKEQVVVRILRMLEKQTGNVRYRPSALLLK